MTDIEILLTVACIFLVLWCLFLAHMIKTLQRAVMQLQGVAIDQFAINSKTAEVQSILEEVNASLLKIVESEKV